MKVTGFAGWNRSRHRWPILGGGARCTGRLHRRPGGAFPRPSDLADRGLAAGNSHTALTITGRQDLRGSRRHAELAATRQARNGHPTMRPRGTVRTAGRTRYVTFGWHLRTIAEASKPRIGAHTPDQAIYSRASMSGSMYHVPEAVITQVCRRSRFLPARLCLTGGEGGASRTVALWRGRVVTAPVAWLTLIPVSAMNILVWIFRITRRAPLGIAGSERFDFLR